MGESAQGLRKRDGKSKRAEQQARRLKKETGVDHETTVRRTFPNKREARTYETDLIERARRIAGEGTLPGNKTKH